MNLKESLQSNKTKKIVFVIAALVVLFLIFGLGVTLGYHKAIFSSHSGENYYRNFYGGRGGLFGLLDDRGAPVNSHGVVGSIIGITSSTLAVRDERNNEGSILLGDDTVIRNGPATINLASLKVGDNVAVIGEPTDQGQIEARFIRVFSGALPPGGQFGTGTTPNLPPPPGF